MRKVFRKGASRVHVLQVSIKRGLCCCSGMVVAMQIIAGRPLRDRGVESPLPPAVNEHNPGSRREPNRGGHTDAPLPLLLRC